MKPKGKFIISLDFELFWGVRDIRTLEAYGDCILGVRKFIPKLLDAFYSKQVRATFATVGLLFSANKMEALAQTPKNKPSYVNKNYSPYNGHFDLVNDFEDNHHFGSELIDLLLKHPEHEIATHTFSHFYCLEKGQTEQEFREDMITAIDVAAQKGVKLKSLVFPRNQVNHEYLSILSELGISSYRGTEKVWFQKADTLDNENLVKRAFRLLDAYLNISGHNCYAYNNFEEGEPFNFPSSRFLRSYASGSKFLESLRLRRILNGMSYAAKNGLVYHIWSHPHNFGLNQDENLDFWNKILEHYLILNEKFGFESVTMAGLSSSIKAKGKHD